MLQTPSILKTSCSFILMILCGLPAEAQTIGSFVDARDKNTYETVTYTVTNSKQAITDTDEYGTYVNKEPRNFKVSFKNGMPTSMTWMTKNLNFKTATSKCKYETDPHCESYGRLYTWDATKKVCPVGWHLPSDNEWYTLASLYDGVSSAGQHLKSKDLGGTNKSFFNIIKPTIFWSSSELDGASAFDWKVNFRWVKLQRWKGGKKAYNAVRCVKDY